VSPVIKLFLILYGEFVGNIFRVKIEGSRHSKLVDLRKGLRVIAKFQCVDVFVSILTKQLLNSDFISCILEDGFYYFAFYSFTSIFASQIIDANTPRDVVSPRNPMTASPRLLPPGMTPLDIFLLLSSIGMFLVGMAWAIAFPILSIKILFQSKIVIGESVASLMTFLNPINPQSTSDVFCSTLVLVTVVVIPILSVTLSAIIQCCDKNRTSPVLYGFAKFTSLMADWSLVDVFAVALLTSLFAFASFPILRASAPWGFYCVLMAAMSAYEVIKVVQTSFMDAPGSSAGYQQVTGAHASTAAGGNLEMITLSESLDEEFGVVPIDDVSDSSSTEAKSPKVKRRYYGGKDYSPVGGGPGGEFPQPTAPPVLKSTIVNVIVTIFRRLGLPFFILKALGWGIFFFIWFLNSTGASLDLASLSSTLRSNIPFVSSAIKEAVPYGVGICEDLVSSEGVGSDLFIVSNTSTTGGVAPAGKSTCIDKPYLHYEKHTTYEVLARWMSGFKNVTVTDMYLSIPEEKTFSLIVSGQFDEIKLSLFVGQCLGNIFSSDDDEGEEAKKIPQCSSIFDSVHAWNNVTWSIEVDAVCSPTVPFVQNIHVDEVNLGKELTIEEEIAFGISVPLDSMSAQFKDGIKQAIQPLLVQKNGWIPWGPKMYDLPGLLSHLVELNVDNHGGSVEFTCPRPQRSSL